MTAANDRWESVWIRIASTAAHRWRAWSVLGLTTFLTFAITFRDYFGSDDFGLLARARAAKLGDVVGSFKFWEPTNDQMPLIYLAFHLQFHVFGVAAWGYRVASVGLHAATAVLVYEICRRLSDRPWIGLLAAILFAVQPAHSQAVMWNAAQQHLLATASYLAALLSFMIYLEADRRGFYGATLVALLLSMLAKEESLTLPLMLFLCEFFLYDRPLNARRLVKYGPMAAILAAYVLVRYTVAQRSWLILEQHYALGWHMLDRFWGYITALAIHQPEPVARLVTRSPWLAAVLRVAAVGIVLVLGAIVLRGRLRLRSLGPSANGRIVGFLLAWLVLTTIPFLPFTWAAQSRYTYLPVVPFSILTASAAEAVWMTAGRASRRRIAAVMAAVLVVYAGCTLLAERNSYYTGVLSADLMNQVTRDAPELNPGTKIVLVNSPLSAETARPIFRFSHPDSLET